MVYTQLFQRFKHMLRVKLTFYIFATLIVRVNWSSIKDSIYHKIKLYLPCDPVLYQIFNLQQIKS